VPHAAVADVFRYTQDNGTQAFGDTLERIPARYRDKAERTPDQPLADYARLTVTERPREKAAGLRVPEDTTSLVAERAAALHAASTDPSGGDFDALLEVAPGVLVPVAREDGDEEPIRVERSFRWIDGRYTRLVTLRRGPDVIAEVVDPSRY
jgi:hypothetical protein